MEKSTFKRRLMFVVCMLMCGLSIQAADDGLITDQVIIDKLVAGTLPQRISSDEKNLITNLKINPSLILNIFFHQFLWSLQLLTS